MLNNPTYQHFEGKRAIFVCNSSLWLVGVTDGTPNGGKKHSV
jgi:hypothetical protein